MWSAIDQPMIRRLKTSWTATTCSQRSHVRTYVISGDPEPVRRRGQESAVDEVRAGPHAGHTDRRTPALARDGAGDRGLLLEPLYTLALDAGSVGQAQLCV